MQQWHVRTFSALILVLFLLTSGTSPVKAQSATASIFGQVTDPQGAAIVGAQITVTNVATQVAQHTVSDSQGNYQVLDLSIGSYVVSAEHAGFAKLVAAARRLEINQHERVDLRLEIGALSQVVEVTGVGTNVETENPTVGESVTSR